MKFTIPLHPVMQDSITCHKSSRVDGSSKAGLLPRAAFPAILGPVG
jgi:hypothetical protein